MHVLKEKGSTFTSLLHLPIGRSAETRQLKLEFILEQPPVGRSEDG